jgi:hypothetical protein
MNKRRHPVTRGLVAGIASLVLLGGCAAGQTPVPSRAPAPTATPSQAAPSAAPSAAGTTIPAGVLPPDYVEHVCKALDQWARKGGIADGYKAVTNSLVLGDMDQVSYRAAALKSQLEEALRELEQAPEWASGSKLKALLTVGLTGLARAMDSLLTAVTNSKDAVEAAALGQQYLETGLQGMQDAVDVLEVLRNEYPGFKCDWTN